MLIAEIEVQAVPEPRDNSERLPSSRAHLNSLRTLKKCRGRWTRSGGRCLQAAPRQERAPSADWLSGGPSARLPLLSQREVPRGRAHEQVRGDLPRLLRLAQGRASTPGKDGTSCGGRTARSGAGRGALGRGGSGGAPLGRVRWRQARS